RPLPAALGRARHRRGRAVARARRDEPLSPPAAVPLLAAGALLQPRRLALRNRARDLDRNRSERAVAARRLRAGRRSRRGTLDAAGGTTPAACARRRACSRG